MNREDTEKVKMRRIVPKSVGEQLRMLYAEVAEEAMPAQLAVLLQRLDEARTPGTATERESGGRRLRQHSI